MEDLRPWIELIATLGLLGVTYWYARTTRRLAVAADATAKDSARAAAAAERAAAFAQAQVAPRFEARDISVPSRDGEDGYVVGIRIESVGAAVLVTEVRARHARFESKSGSGSRDAEELVLEPIAADRDALPRRMYQGEVIHGTHEGLQPQPEEWLVDVVLEIDFKFTEADTQPETRVITADIAQRPQIY